MTIKALTVAIGIAAMANYSPIALSGNHDGSMHGKHHATLDERLDLDEQQRQLLAAGRQQAMAAKKRTVAVRQQLKEIVHSDRYDAAAVETLANQMAEITREKIIQHGATMNEFYRSLTPDQRKTLETIEHNRSAKQAPYQPGSD